MKRLSAFTASLLGTMFAVSPAFAADTTTTFSKNPFSDVPESSSYHEAVEYLRANNVLKGYDDGTFRPNEKINRAEFVKLITNPFIMNTNRMNLCLAEYERNTGEKVFFSDVRKDDWYAPEVCYLKEKQIIKGYDDLTFRPANKINFVEAAKIVSGVFAYQVMREGTPWYKSYVEKFDELNAIPTTITRFNQEITRGEMAEMIYRLKTNATDKPSKTYGQLN